MMIANPVQAGRRVLLIDDEDDIRQIAQLTLDLTMGWEISVAEGGEQGYAIARREQPDLIILDIMMPRIDGFATLEMLRNDALTAGIPVVFMSAKEDTSLEMRVREAGAAGLIPKPFNALTLGAEVVAMLAW